jgi:uncharacterized membrane protein
MKNKLLLILLGIFFLIIFFSFSVNAWTSIGGQTIPTSTIEGNLFTYQNSTSEENVTTPPSSTGGAIGGGGGIATTVPSKESFSLSTEQINVKLQQGTVTTQEVTITNNLNTDLTVEISSLRISNFLRINEPTIVLKPKESRVLEFDIIALKSDSPDLYLGELNFKAGTEEKTILTAVEVISAHPLFDVSVDIPPQFLWITPGKELVSNINLHNLGASGQAVDVNLEYKILDSNGNEILHTTEEIAVNTKISFTKEFIIPEGTPLGRYALYVRATYTNLVASGSSWFNVGKPTQIPFEWAIIIIIGFIIIAIAINYWNLRKIKKEKISCKVSEYDLKETGMIKK